MGFAHGDLIQRYARRETKFSYHFGPYTPSSLTTHKH